MAEIGLVSVIVELAVEGFRVDKTVNVFLNRVHSARKDIRAITTDVQYTSETLQQLAGYLGEHGSSSFANEEWKGSTEVIWRLAKPFSRTLNLWLQTQDCPNYSLTRSSAG